MVDLDSIKFYHTTVLQTQFGWCQRSFAVQYQALLRRENITEEKRQRAIGNDGEKMEENDR